MNLYVAFGYNNRFARYGRVEIAVATLLVNHKRLHHIIYMIR